MANVNMVEAEQIAGFVRYLQDGGTLDAVRTSSAKARGNAKNYPYWGTAHYEIRWSTRFGRPTAKGVSAAPSARRSRRLAEQDTERLAGELDAVEISSIGELSLGDLRDAARVWASNLS